jgi:hypothetical protein
MGLTTCNKKKRIIFKIFFPFFGGVDERENYDVVIQARAARNEDDEFDHFKSAARLSMGNGQPGTKFRFGVRENGP